MTNIEITLNSQQKDFLIQLLEGVRKEKGIDGFTAVVSGMILKKLKGEVEKTCKFGHVCTSRCQNDIDCPCQYDHTCALSN